MATTTASALEHALINRVGIGVVVPSITRKDLSVGFDLACRFKLQPIADDLALAVDAINRRPAAIASILQISRLSSGLRKAETRADVTSAEAKLVKRSHLPGCGCKMCKKTARPTSRRWMLGQC